MNILALNGGSSSLKYTLYRAAENVEELRAQTLPAGGNAGEALADVLASVQRPVDAVGHRIVFGGATFTSPVRADDATMHQLERLVDIEPLHLRAELDLVYAAMRALPGASNVLCFDTAFHRRAPAIAHRLPLPDIDPMLQRYGFHGLSYEYVVSKLPPGAGRTIIAHLGSGASLCALRDGEPLDTTMGFTALGGLMMGTRPGDLDPGVLLRLLRDDGYSVEALSDLLYHCSGLLGVSGSSSDMRTLMAEVSTNASVRNAVDLFVYQLVKQLGSMTAVIGGLDTLVFTGGIGENQAEIRDRVVSELRFLGNFTVLVIPTDENRMIAQHTVRVLAN